MHWFTYTFIGALASIVLGACYLSYSGATLPGPDASSNFSLRDVQNRRAHFVAFYGAGK